MTTLANRPAHQAPRRLTAEKLAAGKFITVNILADCASIVAKPQVDPSQVIFMTDNNAGGGSQNEGQYNLQTACSPGDTIQWTISNANPANGLSVTFLNMVDEGGNVFGFSPLPPPKPGASLYQAVVQAAGTDTYQINVLVGGQVVYSWQASVNSK
ncbi:MAG: hypothetical protein JO152_09330 [Mycobacteriaceae bacterium]|nr:hypothetical protein [Mycobacteriaceae bacterium]